MIRVDGLATLRVTYAVDLDMTEKEWDKMNEKQQNDMLDHRINWLEECKSAKVDGIDVWDISEIES